MYVIHQMGNSDYGIYLKQNDSAQYFLIFKNNGMVTSSIPVGRDHALLLLKLFEVYENRPSSDDSELVESFEQIIDQQNCEIEDMHREINSLKANLDELKEDKDFWKERCLDYV